MSAFSVELSGHDVSFSCGADQSVLDAALAAGYELPYSCRTGICGSCRARVVQGRVDGGAGEGVLGEQDRANGQVLLCQARARSDLTLEVNEVSRRDPNALKQITAKVFRKVLAAPDVTILSLRYPAGIKPRFKSGQYLAIQTDDGQPRYFSMANPAHQADGAELHIRHIPGGRFTGFVAEGLAPGDQLEVSLPFGDFYLRESDAPVILLASGTGFAPIRSMVESAIKQKSTRPMTLYWGGRRPVDLYLSALARKWADKYPWFTFVPVLSDALPEDGWSGRTGYVHTAVLRDYADLGGVDVYACGSPLMVQAARQDFIEQKGLDPSRFYCDVFVANV